MNRFWVGAISQKMHSIPKKKSRGNQAYQNSLVKVNEDSPGTSGDRDKNVPNTDRGNLNVTNEEQDTNVNDYKKKLRSFVKNVNIINEDVNEWEKNIINEHIWNIMNSDESKEERM